MTSSAIPIEFMENRMLTSATPTSRETQCEKTTGWASPQTQ